jgi:putative membrane protein
MVKFYTFWCNSSQIKIMGNLIDLKSIIGSLIYSFLGIFVLVISFVIIEKITVLNLWKEISEKKNTALAIMAMGFMLAIAIIIASAIH